MSIYSRPLSDSYIKTKFTLNTKDFTDLKHNMGVVLDSLIPSLAAEAVGMVAVDVLRRSLPRTPIYSDYFGEPYNYSGKLRESGRATVLYRGGKEKVDVGFGKADGSIDVDLGRLRNAQGKASGSKRISSRVTFSRKTSPVNREGGSTTMQPSNVALWVHEDIMPYMARPKPEELKGVPVATHPGTGPKYLETPFNEKREEYKAFLRRVVSNNAIGKAIQRMGGTRKSALQKIKLNKNSIPHVTETLNTGG